MIDISKEKYLQQVLSNLDVSPNNNGENIVEFGCPFCHEGKSAGRKRRARIYRDTDYSFHCFNCQESMNFHFFLRKYDPELYRQFFQENKQELIKEFLDNRKPKAKKETAEIYDKLDYLEFDNNYVLAKSVNDALEYLKERKIPESKWNDIWYYVPNDTAWSNAIIFPFRDSENKIYGFSTRSINKKFFHIELAGENSFKIFNFFGVNKYLDCYATESIIDSLFLDNSIAMNGASLSKKISTQFKSLIFIHDNDHTGILKCRKNIDRGHRVFIMPHKYKKYKDLNELIMDGKLEPDEVQEFVNDNLYSGSEATLQLALTF
jgi:hypothetical protein